MLLYLPHLLLLLATSISVGPIASLEISQNIKGDQPALMKTTNGCWDVSHIVINKGDSVLDFPGNVGFFDFSPFTGDDTLIIADKLPGIIIDSSFPDVEFQDGLGNNDERYFIVTTKEFVYLYYTFPGGYNSTTVSKLDSFPVPAGYVKAVLNGEDQLLLVNKMDEVNYNYAFYSIPDLEFINQLTLAVKPEHIQLHGSKWYLIVGDSLGTKKMMTLNHSTQQIDYNISLPPAAENTRAIIFTGTYYFLISTPGDSTTNLIQLYASDTLFNVINLYPHSGLNGVVSYYENPSVFILQPSSDTSLIQLHKQLLLVDAVLGLATDTFILNKTISSLHKNTSSYWGWGPYVYSLIMGGSGSSKDFAFYYKPGLFGIVDSVYSPAQPSWFGEDFRCYIGVEEVEENLSIDIFPNPATDQVLIQVNHLAKDKTYKFEVTDIQGKILWSRDIITKQEYNIPLQTFPKGVLIFRVDAGTKVVTKKIIKQ